MNINRTNNFFVTNFHPVEKGVIVTGVALAILLAFGVWGSRVGSAAFYAQTASAGVLVATMIAMVASHIKKLPRFPDETTSLRGWHRAVQYHGNGRQVFRVELNDLDPKKELKQLETDAERSLHLINGSPIDFGDSLGAEHTKKLRESSGNWQTFVKSISEEKQESLKVSFREVKVAKIKEALDQMELTEEQKNLVIAMSHQGAQTNAAARAVRCICPELDITKKDQPSTYNFYKQGDKVFCEARGGYELQQLQDSGATTLYYLETYTLVDLNKKKMRVTWTLKDAVRDPS